MKSCWRFAVFSAATDPSCLLTALATSATALGSLAAITLIRAVCPASCRLSAAWFQSTSMKRSGVAAKASSVGQSRAWIVTPLPVATMPTMASPGTAWQQPAK